MKHPVRKRPAFACCAALVSLLVSGCSLGGSAQKEELYVLKADVPLSECVSRASITLARPEADPGLEGSRIAVFDTPHHIDYYTNARWAADMPAQLQPFLLDAFSQSNAFSSVGADTDAIPASMTILTTIHDFQVENLSHPVIHIVMQARLMNTNSHKILRTVVAEETILPSINHLPQIIEAFNVAANRAAQEIIAEALQETRECRDEPSSSTP